MVAKVGKIKDSMNLLLEHEISLTKKIQVTSKRNMLVFSLDGKDIYTLEHQKEKNGSFVNNIQKKVKLNNTEVTLIELTNNKIIQLGVYGLSIYKSYDEFQQNTVKEFSLKNNIDFILYQQ